MLHITEEELIRTPRGYPEPWRRVFEVFVAPIKLVRAIGYTARNNTNPKLRWFENKREMVRWYAMGSPVNKSWGHEAASKNREPWLSLEEFKVFQLRVIKGN